MFTHNSKELQDIQNLRLFFGLEIIPNLKLLIHHVYFLELSVIEFEKSLPSYTKIGFIKTNVRTIKGNILSADSHTKKLYSLIEELLLQNSLDKANLKVLERLRSDIVGYLRTSNSKVNLTIHGLEELQKSMRGSGESIASAIAHAKEIITLSTSIEDKVKQAFAT